MIQPIVNIAIQAARKAGNIIVRHLERLEYIEITEKQQNDFVTEVDKLAEKRIIELIKKAYPHHGILAEESGRLAGDDNTWIIDPLDGTMNFIHGFPHFAVSIAFSHKNRIEHGVVYDPIGDEMFVASRGEGARLNERRIRVSKQLGLSSALLGTGLMHRDKALVDFYLQTLRPFIEKSSGFRRAGAAALDLAYVAAGRLDGFWELGLKPWDFAAGILLVREAGGLVSDFVGSENFMTSGDVVAANPKVFREMLEVLQPLAKEKG